MSNIDETELRELLAAGKKIEAIKRYREATGSSLVDAKTAVEALEQGVHFTTPHLGDSARLADDIVRLLEQGEKIRAVKLYQQHHRVGLKEAKKAVERIAEQRMPLSSTHSGCFGTALMILCAGAAALLWR